MGYKNVKAAYRIGHSVQIRDGKMCIGSPYVSDLIRITMYGVPEWGKLGPSKNDELARYWDEMNADLPKLRALIESEDIHSVSLPVFTYSDGAIIEKQCEEYGWPNVTHDGQMMYDNSFSADKAEVVKWAKENCGYAIQSFEERLLEIKQRLSKMEQLLSEEKENLTNLETNYPL